jgi:Membrane-bound metallopeptidase
MFIFSADNLTKMYRRLRYVREYATYQRLQGEEILKKQEQINRKRAELQQVKAAKESLLKERESEKAKLEVQEKEKRTLVANLKKKQQGLQSEIRRKKTEANRLNARIDRLIAEEIEKARKRAEEEARREAEARRKAAEAKSTSKESEAKKSDSRKSSSSRKRATEKPMESYSMSREDRELSGNFANNRGRLPMPISGSYIITSHYGEYAVEGLRNVKLDNKGIDIQGRPGAQARAIFDGKVAAVFQLNGLFNVLIRHGNYISVYCNLSSASVKQGDNVSTKQSIGQVFSDMSDSGRTVLHFQLRREKEKLNPEPWLNR